MAWLHHTGHDPFRTWVLCVAGSWSWCPVPCLSTVGRARCPGCLVGRPGIEALYLLTGKPEAPRALLPKPLVPMDCWDVDPPVQEESLLESVGLTPGQACVAYGTFSLSTGPHSCLALFPRVRSRTSLTSGAQHSQYALCEPRPLYRQHCPLSEGAGYFH